MNHFLASLSKGIKKYQTLIGRGFFFASILILPLAFFPNATKITGEVALWLLWFILFLPFFAKVLNSELARNLLPLRKEIGIFIGILALMHGLSYIIPYPEQLVE